MPNVSTDKEDTYVGSAFKLNENNRHIVGIEPLKNSKNVHHIFVFACIEPAQAKSYWTGVGVCRVGKAMQLWSNISLPESNQILIKFLLNRQVFF